MLIGERGIKLRINDFLNIKVEFQTAEQRSRFIRALGDLDPL
jgi:hypothetical protein